MKQKERIFAKLPKKDCGLCGAATCETFAQDCALGEADLTDCIFFKST
jgi:ArsR family metal-binding transcriptional regulator